MVDDPVDAGVDVVDRPAPVTAQHLGDDELRGRRHAGGAAAVVGGTGDTAHVGAVPFVVERGRVFAPAAAISEGNRPAAEIFVTGVDPSVDDADLHAAAHRPGPRRRGADLTHV